jgi:hypothetical protein
MPLGDISRQEDPERAAVEEGVDLFGELQDRLVTELFV